MQFLEGIHKPLLAAKYVSLQHIGNKNKQLDNNITFYIYKETICQCIKDMSHIRPQLVEEYKDIVLFKEGAHDMYVQEKRYLDLQWLSMHYRLKEKYILQVVNDWDEEWRNPVT